MKKSIKLIALALVAVMMCAVLVACAPAKDPADAKAALEENGYTALKIDGLGLLAYVWAGDDVDTVVTGVNGDGENVTIIYYEDNEAANNAWEDIQEYAEGEKDEETDWVCKKSGNMIYFGTSAAVKAAK